MQETNQPWQSNQQWGDERLRAAATRSFTTPAILTMVLYLVFGLPGLIANIVYWNEARKIECLTGQVPEGKGCLTAMLVVFLSLVVVFFVIAILAFLLAPATHHP